MFKNRKVKEDRDKGERGEREEKLFIKIKNKSINHHTNHTNT